MFFSVVHKDLKFFCVMSRDMNHARLPPVQLVVRTVCIFSLALSIVALLGVEWLGGSSSLICPDMAITVGTFPVLVVFIMCSPFVDLFRGFQLL